MKTLKIIILLFCLSSVSFADIGFSVSEVGTLSSIKLGSISGYVMYDETYISDQKVHLYKYLPDGKEEWIASTISNEAGYFIFDELDDGWYYAHTIYADRPQEYPYETAKSFYEEITINNGNDYSGHIIRLLHKITINTPQHNEYVFNPVSLSWSSKPNEAEYNLILWNLDANQQTYIESNVNSISTELEAGQYSFYLKSRNSAMTEIGRSNDINFKVDIPVIYDPSVISTNTTWSGEVHLTRDVTVEEGAQLTIEPGTIIYIAGSDDSNQGVDTYQKSVISVEVYGIFDVVGAPDMPIKFIPEEGNNNADLFFWSGINMHEQSKGQLVSCFISCANIGLTINNSHPNIHSVANNTFNKTDIGVLLLKSTNVNRNDFINCNINIFAGPSSTGYFTHIHNNNFYYMEPYSSWAVYFSNENPGQELNCSSNYWDTPIENIPNRFYSSNSGVILYDPALETHEINNPWTAEIADWQIPETYPGNSAASLSKVTDSDSTLIGKMSNTLGPSDNRYFSLGYGGYITFYLGEENAISDSAGIDFYVYESIVYDTTQTIFEDEAANILLGNSVDGPWEFAARITGSAGVDIDSLLSDNYSYLKIQDVSYGDTLHSAQGFDLDAIYVNHRKLATAIETRKSTPMVQNFILYQNYPNPFNPVTKINYKLPASSYVKLSIYNILGQKVAVLVSEKQPAGVYQVLWDASGVNSGIYYYTLKTGNGYSQTKKMLLLK